MTLTSKASWILNSWEKPCGIRQYEVEKIKDSNPKEIINASFCHKHFIGAVIQFLWKTEV